MGRVYINEFSIIKFGNYKDVPIDQLALLTLTKLFKEHIEVMREIEAIYVSNAYGGSVLGQRILRKLNLTGKPIYNVQNACASGGTALNLAYQSVVSEQFQTVLVLGVEKLSAAPKGPLRLN